MNCKSYFVLSLSLVAGVFAGCTSPVEGKPTEESEAAKAPSEVLIPVEAELPETRTLANYFETTSRVIAERQVQVVAEGMGQCLEVTVEEGDKVEEGQLLARLDRATLEAQIQQSRVAVDMNKYQMDKAREQQAKGILSSFEADNARFAYEQAVATLKVQEIQLKNQDIVAPIKGVITQRMIQRGMVVASGVPAFSIVDPDSFMLPITPPEKDVKALREGQRAEVYIDSVPDKVFNVSVRRINPAVDPASGTVRVLLDFEEADRGLLKDSAFARVKLVMETRENVLAVEKDSLVEENGRKFLIVLRKDESAAAPAAEGTSQNRYIADRVEIGTGLEDSNYVEVTSGIEKDSMIVTLGQQTLKAGALVTVTNAQEAVMANIDMPAEAALKASEEERFDPAKAGRNEDRREALMR